MESIRRDQFPGVGDGIYLNAASVTPLPLRAREAVARLNDRRGEIHRLRDEDFHEPLDASRREIARLIGASPEEIALGGNTTFGINLAVHSLPVPPGSRVVVSDREFPANVYPWMRMPVPGIELEIVPARGGLPDEARILERLDRGDVSVLALSAVQFASGYRADLVRMGRFCRERGIHFVVDGIQALGQVPVDVEEACIDILASGGQKWLCGPFGAGFAYVRRELQPALEPALIGWTGMKACEDFGHLVDYRFELHEDARRFELGTPAFPDLAGLAASVGLLNEVGVEHIERHIQEVLAPLISWIEETPGVEPGSDLSPDRRSGILCVRLPDPGAAFERLKRAGVGCELREGMVRISPHLYNTVGEMERVVDILAEGASR